VKIRREGLFVVGGRDVPLAGACSLLLAARTGRRLAYVGRVEWGRLEERRRAHPRAPGAAGLRKLALTDHATDLRDD
jgi:hypothetical protein